jgi:hypothetical protein
MKRMPHAAGEAVRESTSIPAVAPGQRGSKPRQIGRSRLHTPVFCSYRRSVVMESRLLQGDRNPLQVRPFWLIESSKDFP